jgi:pyruvate dehydrogenase E2 component (dihydrolipoamide acetyltransferase)
VTQAGRFQPLRKLSSWRLLALHLWGKPRDPTVYGTLEIDMSRALQYLDAVNATSGSTHATVTHLVVKAIAKAIAVNPEANALVSRRRVYLRDSVDVYCQVATEGGEDLSGVKITSADSKPLHVIAAELAARAQRVHDRSDPGSERTKSTMLRTPRFLLGPLLRLVEYLTFDLRIDLSRFGVAYDQFGSAMVSNVGSFGIANGLAPLVPATRVPVVLLVGEIAERAIVREGRVVAAPCMTVGCTFDHRVLDGFRAGKMAQVVRACLEDPFREIGLPSRPSSADDRLHLGPRGRNDTFPSGSAYTDRKSEFEKDEDLPT